MSGRLEGRAFHGEFTSADASALNEANSRFTLYGNQGQTAKTGITLAANEQVVITDIQLWSVAAVTVQLYDGANNSVAAGEKIFHAPMTANGHVEQSLTTPHYCLEGSCPKVKTSGAGQVDVLIRGVIVRNGQ